MQKKLFSSMANKNTIPSKLLLTMQVLSFILMSYYVYHANATATNGYVLETLHDEREDILTRKRMLNLKISGVQSIDNIENDSYIQEMVEYWDKAIYIDKIKDIAQD